MPPNNYTISIADTKTVRKTAGGRPSNRQNYRQMTVRKTDGQGVRQLGNKSVSGKRGCCRSKKFACSTVLSFNDLFPPEIQSMLHSILIMPDAAVLSGYFIYSTCRRINMIIKDLGILLLCTPKIVLCRSRSRRRKEPLD